MCLISSCICSEEVDKGMRHYNSDCAPNHQHQHHNNSNILPASASSTSTSIMTCCRNDQQRSGGQQQQTCSSPAASTTRGCNEPVKYVKTGCNNICVKQVGGKEFTISMSPAGGKNGGSTISTDLQQGCSGNPSGGITLSTLKGCHDGPVSIVIHSSPKGSISVHPAFKCLADRKSAAVVQSMRKKMSYRIHSPSNNVMIKLVGDSLMDTLGEPRPYNQKMLLKGGGRCESPRSQQRCSPSAQNCPSGGQNAVKLCMPGSGMKLNIKMGKDGNTRVRCCSPEDACGSANGSPSRSPRGVRNNCNTEEGEQTLMPGTLNSRFSRPTISSLIAVRMTQLKKEMLLNSGVQHSPSPAPPFVNF